MKIGYARVSTHDQSLDRQIDNLTSYGAERIFSEKMTGTGITARRPEFKAMMATLREGDTLIVDSFSRLSRNTRELLSTVDKLRELKVHLVSLKEQLDTTKASGKLMMTMLSALSEFERDTLVERTNDGLKAALARGKKGGRPSKVDDKTRLMAIKAYKNGTAQTAADAGKMAGVSERTVFRWVEEYDREQLEKEGKTKK